MRLSFGTRRLRLLLVVAVAAGLIVASWAWLAQTGPSTAPRPTVPPAASIQTCNGLSLANGMPFAMSFTQSTACFEGSPKWGVNISFVWVSTSAPVNVEVTWHAISINFLVMLEEPIYNATGTYGSFHWNSSSLGSQWAGDYPIVYTFWAGSPGNVYGVLDPGQQVLVRGAVA